MTQQIEQLLSHIRPRLDRASMLSGRAVERRYCDDLSGVEGAAPAAVLRPRGTEETAEILKACSRFGQRLVVQGGRTGLAGGARVLPGEAVLSLERMTGIGKVDEVSGTVIAEAGAPLQALQAAAESAGFVFGVDIGARGTATVGGAIATNAGGARVLRYGMLRAQVLGLEVVLPDGSILSALKGLMKDNSGYDLGQLFIGTEGTLGVVTRACLRLHPKPAVQAAAFCALPSLGAALELLRLLRSSLGPLLSAFEVIFAPLYDDMIATLGLNAPLAPGAAVYVLADIQSPASLAGEAALAEALSQALENGLVSDAVLSQSQREFAALWSLRDDCSRFILSRGPALGLDVGLPLPRMEAFLQEAAAAASRVDQAAETYVFGHLGDGNLHYIVATSRPREMAEAIFGCVAEMSGAITAEHGVGLDKKPYLHLARSPAEIAAMRRLKAAFDPNGILNRGRVFDAANPVPRESFP